MVELDNSVSEERMVPELGEKMMMAAPEDTLVLENFFWFQINF